MADIRLGVNTWLEFAAVDDLRALWGALDDSYQWISLNDHMYGHERDIPTIETSVAHTVLAASTSKVLCGTLVYSIGYRHPAMLAKLVTSIDHVSHGRAVMGIGAGNYENEARALGIPYPAAGRRVDQLAEAVQCVRMILQGEGDANFVGEHYELHGVRNEPRPVQARLPIWVGGSGDRVLGIAAKWADGWNVSFATPEIFMDRRTLLRQKCEDLGRDPDTLLTSVNLALARSSETHERAFGPLVELMEPGTLRGSDSEIASRVNAYISAGADQINLSVRWPWSLEDLLAFPQIVRAAY